MSDFFYHEFPVISVISYDEAGTVRYPDTAGRFAGADNRYYVGTFSLDQLDSPWFPIPEPTG